MREFCKGLMMAAVLGAASFLSFSSSAKAQQEPTPSASDDQRPVISRDRVPAQSDDPNQNQEQDRSQAEPSTQTEDAAAAAAAAPAHPLTKPANGRRAIVAGGGVCGCAGDAIFGEAGRRAEYGDFAAEQSI